MAGDYNGDGRCTEADALVALRMAVGSLAQDVTLMDVTGDGNVSEADALQLLRMAVAGGHCREQTVTSPSSTETPPSSTETPPSSTETPPSSLESGTVESEADGTAEIELYNGSETTLHFIDTAGNPINDVGASYVSDSSGLTVYAAPQDGQHFPTIRYFPMLPVVQGTSTVAAIDQPETAGVRGRSSRSMPQPSPELAAAYQPDFSDIPIIFEPMQFEGSLFVETVVLNQEHLENLPQSMPEWEEDNVSEAEICESVIEGLSLGHILISLVHASVSPLTGAGHVAFAVGEHVVIHGFADDFCGPIFWDDPAEEYVATFNQDLNYAILRDGMQSSTRDGFLVGQVVDSESLRGIPGAFVDYDGGGDLTFSNGWYHIRLREGDYEVTVEADGYDSGQIDAEVEAFIATLADPIALTPDDVTSSLGQGDVKVSLRWNNTADLDLHVTDPDGEEISYQDTHSSSGGELDHDDNYPCSSAISDPVENIFWPSGEAPEGEYIVDVDYFGECNDEGETSFTVTTEVDGRVQSYDGFLSEDETINVTSFQRSDSNQGPVIENLTASLVPSVEFPYNVPPDSDFFVPIVLDNKGLTSAYCVSVSMTADSGYRVLTTGTKNIQEIPGGESETVSFEVSAPRLGVETSQLVAHVAWNDVSDCNGTPYMVDLPIDVLISSGTMTAAPWKLTALVFPKMAVEENVPVQVMLLDESGREISRLAVDSDDIPYVATFDIPREEARYSVQAFLVYLIPTPFGEMTVPDTGVSQVHVTKNGQSVDVYP